MLWNRVHIDETKGERICDGCGLVSRKCGSKCEWKWWICNWRLAGTHFNKIDTLDNSNKLGTSKFIKVQDLSGVNSNLRRVLKNEQNSMERQEKDTHLLLMYTST